MDQISTQFVFLHAPGFYDFRKKKINYGLMAQTVSSCSVFEYFPVGFLSLSRALSNAGYKSLLVNLASRMLLDKNFDVFQFIQNLSVKCICLSIHWLMHAQGTIAIARICKECVPSIPILVGGISATYFSGELIKRNEVDYILPGDSCEEGIVAFARHLIDNKPIELVPNLMWKANGSIQKNPAPKPSSQISVQYDYELLFDTILQTGNPYNVFSTVENPVKTFASIIPLVKGCQYRCVTCGGTNACFGRKSIGKRSVESIIKDIQKLRQLHNHQISLYGDLRQTDWKKLLNRLKEFNLEDNLRFEIYNPASKAFLNTLLKNTNKVSIMMSPETHDEELRAIFGRVYKNIFLEETIEHVLSSNGSISLFFLIGLPFQDVGSVNKTIEYIDYLLSKFCRQFPGQLDANIGPLAPFLDPGSIAFSYPEKFGYRLLCKSFDEHLKALSQLDWREMFNYESSSMSIATLTQTAFQAALDLIDIRQKNQLINSSVASEARMILSQSKTYDKMHPVYVPNPKQEKAF